MIHAFSFTCNRDLELSKLMVKTFQKYCPDGIISISNTDEVPQYIEYGNGAGWPAAMMKLKGLSDILKTNNVKDDDFVLSVDSDVVFTSSEVFKYITPDRCIIGIKHNPEFDTALGKWSHMSGALIFLRGDIVKKMINLSKHELDFIRLWHFKEFDITENEDVLLSYLASLVGARQFELPGHLSSGNFESEVAAFYGINCFSGSWGPVWMRSFYHLNYCPTQFLGEPVTGKWDIPKVLKMKGIEL